MVVWEGVLRLAGGVIMVGYGMLGTAGRLAIASGILNGLVGLIYLVGLPLYLQCPLTYLLLDH